VQRLGKLLLGKLPRLSNFPQVNSWAINFAARASTLFPLRRAESLDDVVYVGGHRLLPFLLQSVEMGVKPIVGLGDELSVESLRSLWIYHPPPAERLALWIERESNPAFAIRRAKPQPLHVGMTRPFRVLTRGLPSCGPNSCKSLDRARISMLTSSCKSLNSGSNSSASSTVHRYM
jgi:hypothetical protein